MKLLLATVIGGAHGWCCGRRTCGAGSGLERVGAVSLGQSRTHETIHARTIQSSNESARTSCAACPHGSAACSLISVSFRIVASSGDGDLPAREHADASAT